MEPTAREEELLLPEGTRLLHIGPHKTGTTSLQGALFAARQEMLAQGVCHAGRSRNPAAAVQAVTGRPSPYSDQSPPISQWRSLVREIRSAREPRVVVSSEFFAWAKPDAIRGIVEDLDRARVHVAVTLRPLGRIMPSHWQQNVQAGSLASFESWLDGLFNQPDGKGAPFWTLHRHDRLIARWAEVVGPKNVTAVVVDDRDHGVVLRAFEQLLGLREGTLVEVPALANRSLTLPETEAIRAFNKAYKAEGLNKALYARVMRFGAAQLMKSRQPADDEPNVEMPQWALDRATEIGREIVVNIAASGVRVVGDLELLTRAQVSRLDGDRAPAAQVSPRVAAAMAMGILVATGAARRGLTTSGPFSFAEPVELARVPTYQVVGVVALRVRNAVARRWRRVRERTR